VKIASNDMQQGSHILKNMKSFLPHRPFEYQFLSLRYQQLYESEKKTGATLHHLLGLAIFIACLGLFGLATSIRCNGLKGDWDSQSDGCVHAHILTLLSKKLSPGLDRQCAGWPAAWYFMGKWLDGFAYKIDLPLIVFVLSTVTAVFIALITVSSQTIKTALTNPAKTLRYE